MGRWMPGRGRASRSAASFVLEAEAWILSCASSIAASARALSSLTRRPTSRLAGPGAAFSQVSLDAGLLGDIGATIETAQVSLPGRFEGLAVVDQPPDPAGVHLRSELRRQRS